jgi:hypothetical protein
MFCLPNDRKDAPWFLYLRVGLIIREIKAFALIDETYWLAENVSLHGSLAAVSLLLCVMEVLSASHWIRIPGSPKLFRP